MSRVGNSKSLVRRHRGKIIFSLAAFTSLIAAGSVFLWMMKRWLYKQQMRLTEQHFIKEQIRRRFRQTQEDSLYALYELIPVFALVVGRNLDLEELVIALKDKKLHKMDNRSSEDGVSSGISTSVTSSGNLNASHGEVRSKAELWNELKTKSLIKLVTVAYTVSSLLLLTRLQLNILTRREYLETAVRMAVEKEEKEESLATWLFSLWRNGSNLREAGGDAADGTADAAAPNKTSYINEQAFLSLSWWLLNRGWLEYETVAQEAVACEFGSSSPRDTLTLEEFGNRLTNVFLYVNERILKNSQLKQALLPPNHLELFVLQQTLDPEALDVVQRDSTILSQLLNETSQCVASTASSIVLESLINECFQYIMGQVEVSTSKKKRTDDGYQIAVFSISCKDCCNSVLKSGVVSMDNELLARLDACPQLDDLSASVYSNFG